MRSAEWQRLRRCLLFWIRLLNFGARLLYPIHRYG